MNDIISAQRIRRRFRISPLIQRQARETIAKRFSWKGRILSATPKARIFRKIPIARLGELLGKVRPAKALAIVACVAFTVFVSFVGLGTLVANNAVAALPAALDPLFLRDMSAFAGVSVREAAMDSDLPPLDLAETFRFENYVVKPGDSLSAIASRHSLSVGTVIAVNGIRNAKSLMAGTVLRIPNMDGLPYTVKKGDSLLSVANRHGVPLEAILDANDLSSQTILPGASLFLPGARMREQELKLALGELFAYPVRGRLTSGYGWRNDPFTGVRRFHAAIDLAAAVGTPIRAAMDGRVSSVGYNSVYGNYVIVNHAGSYQTWYAHLSEFATAKGKQVRQGELIGKAGSTGYSTGSHLHFAIFKNGRALNPLGLLSTR